MKTLRLTRAESAAYSNGERRFWRAMKPQPVTQPFQIEGEVSRDWFTENRDYPQRGNMFSYRWRCPYGKPDDRIRIKATHDLLTHERTITAITVEQRGGKWGWVVEVGA